MRLVISVCVCALLCAVVVDGVDRSKFQTCDSLGFCRRNRRLSNPESSHFGLDVSLVSSSLRVSSDALAAELDAGDGRLLALDVSGLLSGVLRVRLREKSPLHPRFEADQLALVPHLPPSSKLVYKPKRRTVQVGSGSTSSTLVLHFEPFVLDFHNAKGEHVLALNSRHFLNWEFYRSRPSEVQNDLDGEWDEKFGTHDDHKPRGPSAVSLDVTFLGVDHVYGIPTHATNLSLPATRGSTGKRYDQPFRLYNLDVFE